MLFGAPSPVKFNLGISSFIFSGTIWSLKLFSKQAKSFSDSSNCVFDSNISPASLPIFNGDLLNHSLGNNGTAKIFLPNSIPVTNSLGVRIIPETPRICCAFIAMIPAKYSVSFSKWFSRSIVTN